MQTTFGHIQFNVDPKNFDYYSDLLIFLGWKLIHRDEKILAFGHSDGYSLWFLPKTKTMTNDYDGPGMNHLGFHTKTITEVDETCEFLEKKGVIALFDTPRHRPEFSDGEDHTYYQVMFESPDKILFEVVYIGLK